MNTIQIHPIVEYVTFDLAQIPDKITKSQDLKNYILLQCQGESIELIESPKTPLSMYVFSILHEVCPEVVLRTYDNELYTIYSHQPKELVYPNKVNRDLISDQDFIAKPISSESLLINIEDLWSLSKQLNLTSRIIETIEKIKPKIKQVKKTTIQGDVPLLLTLCVQHLINNNSKQIFYQRNKDTESKRIK